MCVYKRKQAKSGGKGGPVSPEERCTHCV
jgi:hypothetical protein